MRSRLAWGVFTLSVLLFAATFAHAQDDSASGSGGYGDSKGLLQELYEKVKEMQAKEDKEFKPFITFRERRGSYESDIKLNFHGNPLKNLPRSLNCYDNNAFVPAWITILLLESQAYGNVKARREEGKKESWEPVKEALKLLAEFRDHNLPEGEGVYTFWPQVLNKTNGVWHTEPDNLIRLFDLPNVVKNLPDEVIDNLMWLPGLGKALKETKKALNDGPENAFHITPDFDDSFVSLGMGGLMHMFRKEMGEELSMWQKDNSRVEKAFEYLVQYAYRPWSTEIDHNLIDPRTFYWIKDYLWAMEESGRKKDNFLLPTTWITNHTLDMVNSQKGVHMPLHVQNIDVTVASNVMSGITLSLLSNPSFNGKEAMGETLCKDPSRATDLSILPSFLSKELAQLYTNTADLLAWCLKDTNTVLFKRRDLTMLYYPSMHNFLWMASRSYFQLNSQLNSDCALPPLLKDAHTTLTPAFRQTATEWLLKEMKTEKINRMFKKPVTVAFWDDFLGEGDEDITGKPQEKHQDRLFSTAQSVNVLLNVWGVFDKRTNKFRMLDETPEPVRRAIEDASRFLRLFIQPSAKDMFRKYALFNAFFSGSARGTSSFTFVYPSTYARHINGTKFDPPHEGKLGPQMGALFNSAFGVEGVLTRERYAELMQQKWFSMDVPTEFGGFNGPKANGWPFWSAPALTHAATLLALSRASVGGVDGGVFETNNLRKEHSVVYA